MVKRGRIMLKRQAPKNRTLADFFAGTAEKMDEDAEAL
jgi:hypothetical protein